MMTTSNKSKTMHFIAIRCTLSLKEAFELKTADDTSKHYQLSKIALGAVMFLCIENRKRKTEYF